MSPYTHTIYSKYDTECLAWSDRRLVFRWQSVVQSSTAGKDVQQQVMIAHVGHPNITYAIGNQLIHHWGRLCQLLSLQKLSHVAGLSLQKLSSWHTLPQ